MATYLMLFRFTEKGMESVRKVPERVQDAKKACARLGAEVRDFYLLMGRYDTMFILDAPDDATAAKCSMAIASRGNVHCETVRAFGEGEARDMVGDLP
jgi:uncharacterized protein with GYD domain